MKKGLSVVRNSQSMCAKLGWWLNLAEEIIRPRGQVSYQPLVCLRVPKMELKSVIHTDSAMHSMLSNWTGNTFSGLISGSVTFRLIIDTYLCLPCCFSDYFRTYVSGCTRHCLVVVQILSPLKWKSAETNIGGAVGSGVDSVRRLNSFRIVLFTVS